MSKESVELARAFWRVGNVHMVVHATLFCVLAFIGLPWRQALIVVVPIVLLSLALLRKTRRSSNQRPDSRRTFRTG